MSRGSPWALISVRERLRRTKLGRVAVRVAPDVASRVTVSGWFGNAVIKVRVVGDVGPADATEIRIADVRIVR